jgi:hypothetical protein
MTNTIGRWIAATFDFRFTGLASLAVAAIFILLKFRRDPGAVSATSCLSLTFSVFTLFSATNAGAVFLLTTQPALDSGPQDLPGMSSPTGQREPIRMGDTRLRAAWTENQVSFVELPEGIYFTWWLTHAAARIQLNGASLPSSTFSGSARLSKRKRGRLRSLCWRTGPAGDD